MLEKTLMASSPLDGFQKQFTNVALAEVLGHALVSIAVPLHSRAALEDAVTKVFGTSLPTCGTSTLSKDGSNRLLGMQPDHVFALFDYGGNDPVGAVKALLGNAGYYTDQSDSWVMLRMSGPLATTALERICPLDLASEVFAPNRVARTVMEHLGVIVLCEGHDNYFLMSPRSSARSFLHALEISIENVL